MNSLLKTPLGVFFTGLVAAVYAISFAAIVYTGDLSQFLDRGIALTLLGAIMISFVGAMTLSYKGSVLGPQDLPAVLLASGAAGIAAQTQLDDDVAFATVASLVSLTAILTGVVGVLLGTFRIAYLARFIPYTVLAGFLATTGLLLLMGGLDIALGPLAASHWSDFAKPEFVLRWCPAILVAIAMVVITRKLDGFLVLPLTLCAGLGSFYVIYAILGIPILALAEQGFLLGPFQDGGFVSKIDPTLPTRADWSIVLQSAPLILTAALSSLMGGALNASGLELALKRDLDVNQEMSGNGIANVLSGLCGGLPGYHVVGQTLLANRLGLVGMSAGLSTAFACGLLLFLGGGVLSVLPVGFFAAVIAYIGIDLILTWLWQQRRTMGLFDFGVVLLIPLIAVTFGFLTAIAVGLMLACVLFVLDYGKLEIVRSQTDMSTRRSLLERPDTEREILVENGACAMIAELSTFLFFGSSYALRQKVTELIKGRTGLRWLILDFRRVHGIDISTRHILQRIQIDCAQKGVDLIFTGLPAATILDFETRNLSIQSYTMLEEAIEAVEGKLISEAKETSALGISVAAQIETLLTKVNSDAFTTKMDVKAGTVVIRQGAEAKEFYLLQSGRLRVTGQSDGLADTTIAYIRPGALVGEMSGYSARKRSATIVADEDCSLLRIELSLIAKLEAEQPSVAAQFHKLIATEMVRRLDRTTALIRELQA